MNLFPNRTLHRIRGVVDREQSGIHKRIDENRELLEFLLDYAPDLMVRCPWVEGWIRSTDEFLVQLHAAVGETTQSRPMYRFPRPMPSLGHRRNAREGESN
ncbi:hypothetical protein [Pandoraea apista]|uniref:hypothetical protein n=1 Tax=Pandoraea apista TaxID=93218 RepID=UPI000658D320|nr:hypothetical protein [Pandoraea apista]CFB60481.1 hypothetical protein LMG16407_00520 [Pandoraea apista]